VLIAARTGLPTIPGNVLAGLEAEVGVGMCPVEFAAQAQSISVETSRAALGQMGFALPQSIYGKAALDAALRSLPRLTEAQIQQYLQLIGL
jgi:hypothetical protein